MVSTRWVVRRPTTCITLAGPGAGSTPYKSTKLVGAHFGGTRQPMAVSWPKRIVADPTARPQLHHVIGIVPTIHELTKITPCGEYGFGGLSIGFRRLSPHALFR